MEDDGYATAPESDDIHLGWAPSTDVPVPEDYEAVRDMLDQNPALVDLGIVMVMDATGASCERSTAQGIIDHLQDMLHGDDPGEMPGDEAFGIGYATEGGC